MQIIRCDRKTSRGGACIIIDNNVCQIKSSTISNLDYSIAQAIISIANHSLNIVCCYPLSTVDPIDYKIAQMSSFLKNIQPLLDDRVPNYLTGDFNLPEIDWQSPDISGSHPHHLFAELVIKNGLDQLVTDCTHDDAILDLTLTDCNDPYTNVTILNSFLSSDHSVVWFKMLLPHNQQEPYNPNFKYDLTKVNWEMINQALSYINWLSLVCKLPIDHAWHEFYLHVFGVIK